MKRILGRFACLLLLQAGPPNKAPAWYKQMYKEMHSSMEGKPFSTWKQFIGSKIHSSSCLTHWNPNSSVFSSGRKIKSKLLIANKLRKEKVGWLMFLYNTGIENEVVDFRELFC